MLLVTVFYFRSHVGSIEKVKAVKSSLAASSGAERQQAVRFKNELKAGICGSGVVKRKLTYGECVHRVQWLEKYCVQIKRRHLKQSRVDFLKKQTGIVNNESQKKVTGHLPILLSNASKPLSFPPSSAPEHLVMDSRESRMTLDSLHLRESGNKANGHRAGPEVCDRSLWKRCRDGRCARRLDAIGSGASHSSHQCAYARACGKYRTQSESSWNTSTFRSVAWSRT